MLAVSIAEYLSWQELLKHLGITAPAAVVPAIVDCALCKRANQLHIEYNPREGGHWLYCRQCGWRGDPIELAAAVWGLSVQSTMEKLVQLGALSKLSLRRQERYPAEYVERRQRLREILVAGSARVATPDTSVGRSALIRYGVDLGLGGSVSRYGEILHLVPKDELQAALGKPRLFAGKGWDEVVVLPFYDLPGHLCGLFCTGQQDDNTLYYPLPAPKSATRPPVGIFALDALQQPPIEMLGRSVFVLQDVELAARLHVRHLRSASKPLPLAAIRDDPREDPTSVWHQMRLLDVIFCGAALTPRLVNLARVAGGKVCVYDFVRDYGPEWYKNRSPVAWLHAFKTRAMSWQDALERLFFRRAATEIEATLLEMRLSHAELREFLSICGEKETAAILRRLVDEPLKNQVVRFCGKRIVETPGGWHTTSGEVISTVIVRIDQIIAAKDQSPYCRCRAIHDGKTVRFTRKYDQIESRLLSAANRVLMQNGISAAVFDPEWDARAIHLAKLFYSPESVQAISSVGWDEETQQFRFPAFTLTHSGETRETARLSEASLPGDLPWPEDPLPYDLAILTANSDASRVFWATLACLGAAVVAPALRKSPTSTLLVGDGAELVGTQTAKWLKCRVLAAKVSRVDYPHLYPYIAGHRRYLDAKSSNQSIYSLLANDDGKLITAAPWPIAQIAATFQKWNVVICERPLNVPGDAADRAARLFSAYLRHLCRHRLVVAWKRRSLAGNLLLDMAEWVRGYAGDAAAEVVQNAEAVLFPAEDAAAAYHFGLLLMEMIRKRMTRASRRNNLSRPGAIYYDKETKELRIPQEPLLRKIRKHFRLQPDFHAVTRSLAEEGMLLAERVVTFQPGRDVRCWFVRAAWWKKILEADRRRFV